MLNKLKIKDILHQLVPVKYHVFHLFCKNGFGN